MKVCRDCGERYHLRVDFCFRDGEQLVLLDGSELPLPRAPFPAATPLAPVHRNRPEEPFYVDPPPDRTSLWMAAAVLLVMLVLVPLVGVVTGSWP